MKKYKKGKILRYREQCILGFSFYAISCKKEGGSFLSDALFVLVSSPWLVITQILLFLDDIY